MTDDAAPPALACVLTSIQRPTACVRRLAATLHAVGAELIVVGDKKGPADFELPAPAVARFLPLAEQTNLGFSLAPLLPTGHYARKNLGYLLAIRRGARCIYETDDDNMPDERWSVRQLRVEAEPVAARPWCNVYRIFSPDELIWPRGFPLGLISDTSTYAHAAQPAARSAESLIQQGLADAAPDVDAVWRLIFGGRDVRFASPRPSLRLPPGTWCPFNSQNTWWWQPAYPLLYLPSYCSFRMTDIWRSFITQRCIWEIGQGVVFHGADVVQERNLHNLMRDFADEVSGYLGNEKLVGVLASTRLESGADAIGQNMLRCYEGLIAASIFPAAEMPLVRAWLADLAAAGTGQR